MKFQNRIFYLFILPFFYLNGQDLAHTVNPFIGTGGHGHTFPGAVIPFGMVQLSPDTRIDGSWDGCSGYHYSDSIIYGFSHTHLSGTGVSDWGDILITPCNEDKGLDSRKYASTFAHKNEKANAGYYAVKLKNQIEVELTATDRVGVHNYKFPGSKSFLFIDLLHRDKIITCDLTLVDSVTINGYRNSEAWAKNQYCFFTLKLNKPIKKISYKKGRSYIISGDMEGKEMIVGALIEFDNSDKKPLIAKVALSSVDNTGSDHNLSAEAKHWDFEAYKTAAEKLWNKQLGKIKITEPDSDKKTIFYSALYHCFIHPSLDMDVDGKYRGRDNMIHTAENYIHYTVFSLWDTYRALHPLFTIIEQKRTNDFINTFYHQYLEAKKLPVWELSSNETNCMIGYHSVSVIADAFMKGIKNYDTVGIYKAMKEAALNDDYGIKKFYSKKFLEINDESESVSKSLEYAYDNWCIAQMGLHFKDKDIPQLLKTVQAYKNLFDAGTGFMRPRINGNWYSPFFPTEINNHYTEGNSWQYSFYVPHDISGLIKLHGSEKNFEAKLDELFSTHSKTTGRDQADVTGLIGQYAHGNEPSQHSPFLYNYIGRPEKTAQRVHQILTSFYKNSPDGLIGNDDCGQMSAWYVLASIGMYQICPGNPEFVLFQPLFKETQIAFEDGKTLKIESELSKDRLISGFNIDKKAYMRSFITYNQIVHGGNLKFDYMSKSDILNPFGSNKETRPLSQLKEFPIIPTPIILYKSKAFIGSTVARIIVINTKADLITYTTDTSFPTKHSSIFKGGVVISHSTQLKTKVYLNGDSSEIGVANLFRINTNQIVKVKSKSSSQYSAEGDRSLVDGVFGDTDWRKGEWLGYQGQDFECVIENKEKNIIKTVNADFLQDTRSWIIFPRTVAFFASSDGINFKLLETILNDVPAKDYTVQTKKFELNLQTPQPIKFLKVVAKNFGRLPDWHEGKGGASYLFIDEIEMK